MPYFPTEIITDILTRLPAKSLLRFRSVSKPWCSIIDCPKFIRAQLRRSIESGSNQSLILGGLGFHSVDLDSLDKSVPIDLSFLNCRVSDIMGSCNGLVLLVGESVVIANPLIRDYRKLPDASVRNPTVGVSSFLEIYGFGYDSVNDDYKVIKVVQFRGIFSEWRGSVAKIYSLKSDSWRNIKDFPYCLPFKREWKGNYKGALHSIALGIDSPQEVIVAFDMQTEEFYTVPKPDLTMRGDFGLGVVVFGDSLSLLHTYRGYTDIWVMKDYGVKESWTKLFSIGPPNFGTYVIVCPLAYSKNGHEVLINYDEKRLIWYDLKKKTAREVPVRGLPFVFYGEVWVGSLVPVSGRDRTGRIKKPPQGKANKIRKKRDDFLAEGFKLVL